MPHVLCRKFAKDLDAKKPVIICGDMNVSHKEIDLKNPKTNTKNAGKYLNMLQLYCMYGRYLPIIGTPAHFFGQPKYILSCNFECFFSQFFFCPAYPLNPDPYHYLNRKSFSFSIFLKIYFVLNVFFS